MRKLKKILAVILAVIVVLFLSKNFIVKAGVETAVRSVTGLKLKIGSFKMGVLKPLIEIKELKLFNPSGFPDKVMLHMPEIFVKCELGSLLKGKVHVNNVKLHMNEFYVVKNKKGELNLDSLKMVEDQKAAKEGKPSVKKSKGAEIQIDNLALKVGKVIYKDYSVDPPSVKEFDINLDENHQNIRSLETVVSLIVVKTLTKTTIASLTNFDLQGLSAGVSQSLKSAGKLATDTVDKTAEQTKKALDKTTGALKDTAEDLKGMIKNPFGNK